MHIIPATYKPGSSRGKRGKFISWFFGSPLAGRKEKKKGGELQYCVLMLPSNRRARGGSSGLVCTNS